MPKAEVKDPVGLSIHKVSKYIMTPTSIYLPLPPDLDFHVSQKSFDFDNSE